MNYLFYLVPVAAVVAKLEIENERLKKGYLVKGAGAAKEYVTGRDKSLKLLTSSDRSIQ